MPLPASTASVVDRQRRVPGAPLTPRPTRPPSLQVKWMMYWIVFAFFTTAETLTDIVLSW